RHHSQSIVVERRQHAQRLERLARENIGVRGFQVTTNLQHQRPPEDVRTAAPGLRMNFCTRQLRSSPVQISFSATHEIACTQPNWPSFRPATPNWPTSLPSRVIF